MQRAEIEQIKEDNEHSKPDIFVAMDTPMDWVSELGMNFPE